MRATSFRGHNLIKLMPSTTKKKQQDWVFDTTDFSIYRIDNCNTKNIGYSKVSKLNMDMQNGNVYFERYNRTPLGVLKQAEKVAKYYYTLLS